MSQSINLIPKEEKVEQAKERLVKGSTLFTLFLLIVVGGVGGFLYTKNASYKKQIADYDSKIESLRGDINGLADIEIAARNLDKKTLSLKKILENRPLYSILFTELQKRTPSGIEVENVSLRPSKDGGAYSLDVSGLGSDYLTVSSFVTTLTDTRFASASEGYEKLFTNVALNSVGLDKQTGIVNYRITIDFDKELLKK